MTDVPETEASPSPKWMQELIDTINRAAINPISDEEFERIRPRVAAQHEPIRTRAQAYCHHIHEWLRHHPSSSRQHPGDPRAVIEWFHTVIPGKIVRALKGFASEIPEVADRPADHDGSAKVALIGIDHSHEAFVELAERGVVPRAEIAPFIDDLEWLREELERVFPHARAFVRPGFDEPDEVAKLETISAVSLADDARGTERRSR